jgi:hypothetical protein
VFTLVQSPAGRAHATLPSAGQKYLLAAALRFDRAIAPEQLVLPRQKLSASKIERAVRHDPMGYPIAGALAAQRPVSDGMSPIASIMSAYSAF